MITGAAQTARFWWLPRRRSDAADAGTRASVRQVGVPYIVVALNKCDAVDDPELLGHPGQSEVRELLKSYKFPATHAAVIRLSALGALKWEESGRSRSTR